MKPFPSPENTKALLRAQAESGSVAFGLMGLWFGLLFGLAGGLACGSVWSALRAGVVGLVVGGPLVAGVSVLLLPLVYEKMGPLSDDLMVPLLCHTAIWSLAGAVGGTAFGLGA
jgi:hypothetical protein